MGIKVESFSDYEVVIRKRIKESTKNEKLAEKLLKLMLSAFMDGHNMNRDGFIEIDVS